MDENAIKSYKMYGETISSIAKKYNVSRYVLKKYFKENNVSLKTHKQVSIELGVKKRKNIPSKNELIRLHNNENLSIYELQKIFGVGQKTVYEWFDLHDIKPRTLSESCSISKKKKFENIQFPKNDLIKILDRYDHNKNVVADYYNVSVSHIKKLIKKYSIISNNISYKSKGEIDLLELCKNIRPDLTWISGDRSVINPYELDVYCPELNLALEYCGIYWHSEYWGKKDPKYHQEKTVKCQLKNIELLTIFETDDRIKVKNLLMKKLKKIEMVYGRNTDVIKLDKKEASIFHKIHHLHNSIGSTFNLGLLYKDELVQVASYGKSRFNKNYEWECTRCTSHSNIGVTGGVSKLFKAAKNHGIDSLITYADLRFGSGSVYSYCGLKKQEITPPNYWYFYKNNPEKLYSRVVFQKHKLKNALEKFDENLTEYQNMLINGWDRIWDCGNAKYVSN